MWGLLLLKLEVAIVAAGKPIKWGLSLFAGEREERLRECRRPLHRHEVPRIRKVDALNAGNALAWKVLGTLSRSR
jgi:hypothetical protein